MSAAPSSGATGPITIPVASAREKKPIARDPDLDDEDDVEMVARHPTQPGAPAAVTAAAAAAAAPATTAGNTQSAVAVGAVHPHHAHTASSDEGRQQPSARTNSANAKCMNGGVTVHVEDPAHIHGTHEKRQSGGWTGDPLTASTAIKIHDATPSNGHGGHKKVVLSEFAKEMEHRFGKPNHGFAKLKVVRQPFFSRASFWHFLHKPQLKQYFKNRWQGMPVMVRTNYERKAHWNELFFDLVFVCVFERVAHSLHQSAALDGRALTEFSVLFCAAWKIWFDLTSYVNQWDPTDTLHKFYFLLQMIFVMGLAVMSVKGVIGSYLAATGTTLLLRCWGAYYSPRARWDAAAQTVIYVLGAIPWIASLAYSNHVDPNEPNSEHTGKAQYQQFELWAVGLFIHYIGQFLVQGLPHFHIPLNIEHITERLGIFTILCMGEQILNIIFTDQLASSDSFMMAALGGVIIFSQQILYFDIDGFVHKMHALRGSRIRGYLWALLHCPFQGAIILSSVAFEFFVASTLKPNPDPDYTSFVDLFNDDNAADLALYTTTHSVGEALEFGRKAMESAQSIIEHGLLEKEDVHAAQKQLFALANGGILLILFLIACLHIGREGHVIRRRWRLIARGACTVVMFLLHLTAISPLGMMAVTGLMMAFLAILDIYGGFVPKKDRAYVQHNAGSAGVGGSAEQNEAHHNDGEHEADSSDEEAPEKAEVSVISTAGKAVPYPI